ncbi:DNA-methyltransferase [Thermodesulfobacteriota bacterium]
MPNRSHFNPAHQAMNVLRKTGKAHSSEKEILSPEHTNHVIMGGKDCVELLHALPDESIQLIICDPPYNLNIAEWDEFEDYIDWASEWLQEVPRVLKKSGSIGIFGGFQFQSDYGGDLLEIMHYIRHNVALRLVNVIIWRYKNGMSAHRFFANRHEELVWYAKTKKYTFNLDAVRIPFNEAQKKAYKRDKRLKPESIEKGMNPTNVWEIPRLNGNAKERVGHETQKPLALIRRLVSALSNPGDVVLDFFAGSGSATVVCIESGRHSIASDADNNLNNYLEQLLDFNGRTKIPCPFHLFGDEGLPYLFPDSDMTHDGSLMSM